MITNNEKEKLTIESLNALENFNAINKLTEKQIEDYNSFQYRLYFAKSLTDYHNNTKN